MPMILKHRQFVLMSALLLALGLLPAYGQNYDPDNEDLKPLMTLGGGTIEFFINLNSLTLEDEDEGELAFDVVWYSVEQKFHGGFNRAQNRLNCLKGLYTRSPVFQEFNADGDVVMSNAGNFSAQAQPTPMFLRNDHLPLYNNLKDTCFKYSELEEDVIRW